MNQINEYLLDKNQKIVVPVFYGEIRTQMRNLTSLGYIPASFEEILEQRIRAWNSENERLSEMWEEPSFDSADSIIFHPDGRIKVVQYSERLININPNSPIDLSRGELILPEGSFDEAKGEEFQRKDLERFVNIYQKEEELLENPILLYLVRNKKELLKEYLDLIKTRTIISSNYMRIRIGRRLRHYETERFWTLGSISINSNINGNYLGLPKNANKCNLVGVPPRISQNKNIPNGNENNLLKVLNMIN